MKYIARFALAFALLGVPIVHADDSPPVFSDNAALQYWQGSASLSEATSKRLDDFDKIITIEGDTLTDVRDNNPSIEYVHIGAGMPKCDWGLDLRKGPDLLLPHLHVVRNLGRLSLLRARYRFEQGRYHDGLGDVLATFKLAERAGDTPIMISVLVRYSIEQSSIDTLARHLPNLDRQTLDELAKALETIPAPDTLKRVWATESKYFVDWTLAKLDKLEKESAGDANKWTEGVLALSYDNAEKLREIGVPPPAKLRELLHAIKGMIVEEERITDLPAAEQDAQLIEIQKPFKGNPLQPIFVPEQNKIFLVRRRWQARHAMLNAAVAVMREGEKVLQDKKYADPFGDGTPFGYRKTGAGFTLESKFTFETKPVTLVVGK